MSIHFHYFFNGLESAGTSRDDEHARIYYISSCFFRGAGSVGSNKIENDSTHPLANPHDMYVMCVLLRGWLTPYRVPTCWKNNFKDFHQNCVLAKNWFKTFLKIFPKKHVCENISKTFHKNVFVKLLFFQTSKFSALINSYTPASLRPLNLRSGAGRREDHLDHQGSGKPGGETNDEDRTTAKTTFHK